MEDQNWKEDGFENERLLIIPTEAFGPYADHPLVRALYPTDVGHYPRAAHHHIERNLGCDQYILLCCTEGRGTVEVEDVRFELRASDAICIPRLKRHRYYADDGDPWSLLWVHFKGENASCFPIDEARVVHMDSTAADRRIAYLFALIFRVLERNYTQGNFIYLSQALSLILSEIYYREKPDESPARRRIVTRAVRFMAEHINGTLKAETLCRMLGVSSSHLNAIFRKETGRAPMEFFQRLKMREASRLLEDTDMRVSEVAAALGYDDPYYFSRVFRKCVGTSPRAYRASHDGGPIEL